MIFITVGDSLVFSLRAVPNAGLERELEEPQPVRKKNMKAEGKKNEAILT